MTERTAPWTWQRLDALNSLTEVTADHIRQIRDLTVVWNTAENGAAGLATPAFDEIGEDGDPAFHAALDVFMSAAKLDDFTGQVWNPYVTADPEAAALIVDVPDADIRALFMSGENIPLIADAEDLALWRAASRDARGIDPKRPFGTTNVSRDLRVLLDPGKKLGTAAFTRLRRHRESRLMLMLQFFVQNAALAPGLYRRDDWVWHEVSAGETPAPELLTRDEWADRLERKHHYDCEEYVGTVQALTRLVWENRVKGSYDELERQFRLHDLFDPGTTSDWEGRTEDQLRAALQHFPEPRGDGGDHWFTLSLARRLNAAARHTEAKEVLVAAGLFEIAPADVDTSAVNPLCVAFLEGIIARRGIGILPEAEFQAILANTHSAWANVANGQIWSFVWGVQHEAERYAGAAGTLAMSQAQAVAAQIELMRGGYDPDHEVQWF